MSAAWNWATASAKRLPVAPSVCRAPRSIGACCLPPRTGFVPRQRGRSLRLNGRLCSTICTRSASATRPPAEVYGTLIDEGIYLCSIRTMHRILAENGELKERRNQLRHPQYKKPELLATGPNQVWSWDITKLLGPAKWTYFHLYVILTSSVATWWVGWWLPAKPPSWPSV